MLMPIINPYIAVVGGVTSLHYRTTVTSSVPTITVPSTVEEGDLLLLCDFARNNGGTIPTEVVPTDFSILASEDASPERKYIISWKIATSTDADSVLTGMNGSNQEDKTLLVFYAENPASSYNISTVNSEYTVNDPASQNVAAASGTSPLVVIGIYRQNTVTSHVFTPSPDATITGGGSWVIKYKIYDSSPADTTVDCGDGGALNFLASFYAEAA